MAGFPQIPWRRAGLVALVVTGCLLVAAVGWAAWTYQAADRAIDRRTVETLHDRGDPPRSALDGAGLPDHLNVLVVGSDRRDALTDEERAELTMGSVGGENTDTLMVVQLRPDDDRAVSVLSIPRDLLVEHADHGRQRINALWALGGPDALVGAVEDLLDIDLDHYVEVSVPAFVDIVDAVGHVEICLDEPLRDPRSGADFRAGCHRMDGADALAYVRSREGERGDFERAERQQRFLRALARRATDQDVLTRPTRLRALITETADSLTVDEQLSTGRALRLAAALGPRISGQGIDAFTLPGTTRVIDGVDYVEGYEPAVRALGERLAAGEPLPPGSAGSDTARVELVVGPDPQATDRIESVLHFAGLQPHRTDVVADALGEVDVTTVFAADPGSRTAQFTAGALAAEVTRLPRDWSADADVVVVHADAPS